MKYILSFILFICVSFGFEMPQYESVLSNVENGTATIANNPSIVVGSSGVVMHTFSNGEKSIIARAVVTEKSGNVAKVRFEVYENLAQDALPVPGVMPKNGDKVILNYLYTRSLIIAPNEEVYRQVVEHFSNISFVSPDIAGAYLADMHSPNPSREDFRHICYQNAAGLIFIAFDGEGVFADCGSFKPLHTFKSGKISGYMKPFYTNVRKIKSYIWDFDGGQISNYETYYRKLLEQNNDQGK